MAAGIGICVDRVEPRSQRGAGARKGFFYDAVARDRHADRDHENCRRPPATTVNQQEEDEEHDASTPAGVANPCDKLRDCDRRVRRICAAHDEGIEHAAVKAFQHPRHGSSTKTK